MFLKDPGSCEGNRLKRSGVEAGKAVKKILQVGRDNDSLAGVVETDIKQHVGLIYIFGI